jgi:C-terminal processing protease CtpA/Prc
MTPLIVNPSGSWQFQKPVVVLVGRGCASANEGFISAMREISTVTVVGDTTEGSDGNPEIRSLSNGWMYSVSTWIAYTADKKVIERNGIPPDIYVGASSSDFASRRDPVLEFGLQILRQKIAGNSN